MELFQDCQSCDTLGVHATLSVFRTHMLGKNSDRPVGEAQPLVWYPAADHENSETVDCSGFVIPQAAHTFGVLGFKPYWIWGFEMGANDRGVVIGNEAEFSRDFGKEPSEGLLGMDLLRLGLERGATAREALDVIAALLERYGQNHNASALKDRRYENSFLIMDEKELWVLETAGRRWCAKRVSTFHALGNTYSLGDDFELSSSDLEVHARENGWLLPYEPFSFEKAYSAPIPYFGLTMRAAFSQPCGSLYLPVYPGFTQPEPLSRGEGVFDGASLWWLMDRLAKTICIDPERFAPAVRAQIVTIEEGFERRAEEAEAKAAQQFAVGDAYGAHQTLYALTVECAGVAAKFATENWQRIREELHALGVTTLSGLHADFLRAYCELTKMELL